MSSLEITFSLLLLIVLGYLFKGKIKSKEQREGIRLIILSIALPATIFIALLKVKFSPELILVPVLALLFNLLVYFILLKLPLRAAFNLKEDQYRTLLLLIPSLAPGLSCFPFILEFSNEATVALAALADLGNKIFVLIISYVIAMRWYFRQHSDVETSRKVNVKEVLMSLINEPVNLVIVVAISMLSLGLSYEALPGFVRQSIDKISLMMTPLVLLFIGLSVKLTWHQVKAIFSFLMLRSSLAFLVSGIVLLVLPVTDPAIVLLIVVFPQSACSFWPYSHMAAVHSLENKTDPKKAVFDLDFGMNVLACSMPFSVAVILLIYTSGNFFTRMPAVFGSSAVLLILALVPMLFSIRYKPRASASTGSI
jgi:malate permease and related proteins